MRIPQEKDNLFTLNVPQIVHSRRKYVLHSRLPELAFRGILQTVCEGMVPVLVNIEIEDYLKRLRYSRTGSVQGYRNGYQKTIVRTPLGPIDYSRPKLTGASDFRSLYKVRKVLSVDETVSAWVGILLSHEKINLEDVRDLTESMVRMSLTDQDQARLLLAIAEHMEWWRRRSLQEVSMKTLFLEFVRCESFEFGRRSERTILMVYGYERIRHVELLGFQVCETKTPTFSDCQNALFRILEKGLKPPERICGPLAVDLAPLLRERFPETIFDPAL